MTDPDATCQQRAAHITYHLILRALTGMEGLTTGQVADMLGITYDGARQLVAKLQAADGVPIVHVGDQWLLPRDQLIDMWQQMISSCLATCSYCVGSQAGLLSREPACDQEGNNTQQAPERGRKQPFEQWG